MNFVPNTMGRDGFFWFQGVVEDRQDPKKLGRCRVRVLGLHTKDKTLIPTQELPWAYVMSPITSAAMSGLGETPLGPVPGTWVVGFFRDGEAAQEPIIIGTIAGIPEEPTQKPDGFYDPRPDLTPEYEGQEVLHNAPRKFQKREYHKDGSGVTLTPESDSHGPRGLNFPRESHPLGNTLNEPDTNRLARHEKIDDTIVQLKKDTVDTQIPIAFSGEWDEPTTPYDAIYPYNHVKESESGHIEEVDDTPKKERTHRWNRSGTFEEIVMDGSKTVKVVGDNYEIIMKSDKIHIMGGKQETIQHDYDLYCQQRLNIQVDGNVNLLVHGSVYEKVDGDVNATVGGSTKMKIGGNLDISTGGEVNIQSSGDFSVDAPNIWLNSGKAHPATPTEPKQ